MSKIAGFIVKNVETGVMEAITHGHPNFEQTKRVHSFMNKINPYDLNSLCINEVLTKEAGVKKIEEAVRRLGGPEGAKKNIVDLARRMRNRSLAVGVAGGATATAGGVIGTKALMGRLKKKKEEQAVAHSGVHSDSYEKQAAINVHPSNLELADRLRKMFIQTTSSFTV